MSNLSQVEKDTKLTLSCFPDLTKSQTDKVIAKWAENEYEDTWHGHQQAQAKLMALCRWESMSEVQREQETERMRKGNQWLST